MKVVRLYDANPKLDKLEIVKKLNEDKSTFFFIASGKEQNLFKYIDELGLDNKDDFYFKVLNEVDFNFNVVLKSKNGIVIKQYFSSLSSLFEAIEQDKIETYKIVLDTEDKEILSDVIQQFIYANLIIDITLKVEEERREIVEKFKTYASKIVEKTVTAKDRIASIELNNSEELSIDIRRKVVENLSNTISIIQNTQDRPIKVALLGPRRNGKSEIANCILGADYVPTTADLITPTNCIYEKSPDNILRVIEEDVEKIQDDESILFETQVKQSKETTFKDVDQLRNYLLQLFKKVQLDDSKGFSIPEIRIQTTHHSDANIPEVILIDTPGPNIAKTPEHRKMAYRWLKEADVVLFVIELQYARNNENAKFLEDVNNEIFGVKDKNYSLIIAGNKIDQRFKSGEKPSVIRILDLFKHELESIGIKAFASIATSALTFNGLSKVLRNYNESSNEVLTNDDPNDFETLIDYHFDQYGGGENEYMLSAGTIIDDQANALKRYYKQKATMNLIRSMSGIDTLIRFTRYIAEEKALFEVISFAIISIQRLLVSIKINLLAKNILEFEGNKENVLNLLNGYKDYVKNIIENDLPEIKLENTSTIVDKVFEGLEEVILVILITDFVNLIKNIDGNTASTKEELIDSVVNNFSKRSSTNLNLMLEEATINALNEKLKDAVNEKKNKFSDIYKDIKKQFEKVKDSLKIENLDIEQIKFPEAPHFIPPVMAMELDIQDNLRLYLRDNVLAKSEGGRLYKLAIWLDKNLFNGDRMVVNFFQGFLSQLIDEEFAKKILRQGDGWSVYYDDLVKTDLGLVFRKQASDLSKHIIQLSKSKLDSWQKQMNGQITNTISFVEDQIDVIIKFINGEYNNIDEQIKFLQAIKDEFDHFMSIPEIKNTFNFDKNLTYDS